MLLALLSVGKDDAEVLTVIRCCVLEKLTGACQWDAFGKAEITKACGPPNNWITRQTVATGAMEQWLTPAKAFVNSLSTPGKTYVTLVAAMVNFREAYDNYEEYTKNRQSLAPAMKEELPTWISVDLRNFLRSVYSGRRDSYWATHLSKPPRGGIKAAVWDGVLKECLESDVKKITEGVDKWKKALMPEQEEEEPSNLQKAFEALGAAGKDGIAPEDSTLVTFANLHKEIQDQADTHRSHWFSFLPFPKTSAEAIKTGQGSGAWQHNLADGRVCFVYALSLAYDREQGASVSGERYSMPLWDEDFGVLARAIGELITKDNKNYAVILLGPQGFRQSHSISSQYGI